MKNSSSSRGSDRDFRHSTFIGGIRNLLRLIVVVIFLLTIVSPDALAEDTDPVSLQFNWPSPITLRIERVFEREERRSDGTIVPPISSASRYVWRGERTGKRYKITFSDFAVVRAEPKPKSTDPIVQLEYLSRSLEPLLPNIVVNETGELVELEGLPALRERSALEYRSVAGLNKDATAQKLVEVLTSEALLTQRALEDWNRMVQAWHSLEANIGETMDIEGNTGDAAKIAVRNTFSYTVERRLACEEGDKESSCIRVVIKQVPHFKDTRLATRSLLGFDLTTGLGAPPDAKLEFVNTFITDTHPRSLLPIRYEKEKRWSVSWNDSAGKQRVTGRTDCWKYEFTPIK